MDKPMPRLKHTKGEKVVFSVRLPKQLVKALEKSVKDHGLPKALMIQMIIENYLEQETDTN